MVTRRSVLRAIVTAPSLPVVAAIAGCSRPDPAAPGTTPDTISGTTPGTISQVSPGGVPIAYLPGVGAAVRQQTPALVDAALSRVRSVWTAPLATAGRELTVPRSVQVTATQAQFVGLGGGSGQGVAATTRADGTVVLAPDVWTGTTGQGRIVVIAHELTHVVLHSQTSGSARWLVEGPPEWTAYHGTSLTVPAIAPQLAAAVRAGRPATGPPADTAFTNGPLQAAYQSAFTWCTFLVQRSTTAAFAGFVLAATDHSAAQLPAIFEAHFGTSMDGLTSEYEQFQRTTFGAVRPSA